MPASAGAISNRGSPNTIQSVSMVLPLSVAANVKNRLLSANGITSQSAPCERLISRRSRRTSPSTMTQRSADTADAGRPSSVAVSVLPATAQKRNSFQPGFAAGLPPSRR